MHIAIVSTHGLSADAPAIARELGRGHSVTVYTRSASDIKGVRVEQVPAGPAGELSDNDLLPYISDFSDGLKKCWRQDRPDVIHAHSWTGGLAAIAGSDGLGVPVTQTFHHGDAPSAPVQRLERAIGRRARAVIAACAGEESELIKLGVPRRNIAVVPSGVDVERFRRRGPAAPRGERARMLHIGDAGAAMAIQALASVPGAELVVAGGDDAMIARLGILARDKGVEDRVELLGRVAHANMPKLIRSADVALALAPTAPTGMAALEAMACGIPVIVSATGAHLDAVVHGVTGYHVRRPAEVVVRMRQLLGDRTLRTALGFAGVDRARSRYSLERVSQELIRVYENICA
ncbi:glycosyl transferase [Acrocarpospora corrugata]|uniref:Glycosyl transferase n=1 Tax=Acrocarpospora corrugata TaxID=35763 RepID=A0A5M3VYW7_9ACTN|nr:glycosyltransferase [Acrocarpospora corrugata]GER99567.1 glycosyl transferase [Acrocarpospora corrugata]